MPLSEGERPSEVGGVEGRPWLTQKPGRLEKEAAFFAALLDKMTQESESDAPSPSSYRLLLIGGRPLVAGIGVSRRAAGYLRKIPGVHQRSLKNRVLPGIP
eukprot:1376574-Amorphochlora_amoeboformis.AAC.1